MAKLRPLGGRVLVKRLQAKQTRGGIYLPESAQKKPQVGEVVAIGNGSVDEDGNKQAVELSIGSQVYFSTFSGNEVKLDGEEDYLILNEDDILCVVEA